MSDNEHSESDGQQKLHQLFRHVFDAFDTDHSGAIEPAEAEAVMARLGVEVSHEDFMEVFDEIDSENMEGHVDGKCTFEEVARYLSNLPESHQMTLFSLVDTDEDGRASPAEVLAVADKIGVFDQVPRDQIEDTLHRYSTMQGDDVVDALLELFAAQNNASNAI
jgi:Ca2+-binding EF-hand superfamily protein